VRAFVDTVVAQVVAILSGLIQVFQLVVDKGSADSLMSFCGTSITKISPIQFQIKQTDFTPDGDLHILILNKMPRQ
jgi:hypothetical protein